MSTNFGLWDLKIVTPIGTQKVVLELSQHNGTIQGFARGDKETIPLIEPVLSGNHLTWRQSITKPMRLNLVFDVTIEGDSLNGTSKAGRLPASKVTGTRIGETT
ncbi:MAG: hypothetical protein J0I20_26295 [Chloroflexi bacterium]|nr:hypothetical protein [Chloroflexota bacterium]OJV91872.1 MAG: hypothetical protein BGO39_14180 [Chloroflexi bacterium 54-19]